MAARKTVSVEFVKERANAFLANSEDGMAEMRKGIAALLESVLFEANAYKGFGYLPSELSDEFPNPLKEGYDDTRRRYF